MIEWSAKKITALLLRGQAIREEDKEIYQYGTEILISTFINLVLVLLLGAIFRSVFAGVVYFLVLATVRTQAGGYHASTYFRCGMVYCLTFLGVLALIHFFVYIRVNLPCLGLGLLINVFIMWWSAPVLHHRKMEKEEMLLAKKRTGIRGLLWTGATIAVFSVAGEWAYAVFASFLVVTVYLFLGKKLEEKGYEETYQNDNVG